MKSLKEYILESQNFLVNKHTNKEDFEEDVDVIERYLNSRFWDMPEPNSKYYKVEYVINKDSEGYYIDVKKLDNNYITCGHNGSLDIKSFKMFFKENIDKFNKFDNEHCPYFRWRKYDGKFMSIASNLQNLDSLEGLPQEINMLTISECAQLSGVIDLDGIKIKKLRLYNCGNISLKNGQNVKEITYFGYNSKEPKLIGFSCKNMHKE